MKTAEESCEHGVRFPHACDDCAIKYRHASELLWYINEQFPATCGHIPLREKLENLVNDALTEGKRIGRLEGLREAVEICRDRYKYNNVINATYLAGESVACKETIQSRITELEKGNTQ